MDVVPLLTVVLVDEPLLIVDVVVVPQPDPLVVIEREPETMLPGMPPVADNE